MRRTSDVAVIAVFSALIVGSDFALASFVNIKLLDTIVFVVAFVFGFRVGAAVAIVSETAWSFMSPWGLAGVVTPFLVGGELIFVVAGWWCSRVWGGRAGFSSQNAVYIGAVMLLCAFLWDLETNAATALIANWPALNLQTLLSYEGVGIPFALVHEEADFVLGTLLAPVSIPLIPRMMRGVK